MPRINHPKKAFKTGGSRPFFREKFNKMDTLTGLALIRMDVMRGHTYDYQDPEKGHFETQAIEKHSMMEGLSQFERL